MKLILIFLFLFLFLPYSGLFFFNAAEEKLVGGVDNYLKFTYGVHIFIVLFFIFSILHFFKPKNSIKIEIPTEIILKKYKKIIFILCIVILTNLFLFDGYKILLGEVGRGYFRITLGDFGFIYSFNALFLSSGLLALSANYYIRSSEPFKVKKYFLIIFLLSMLIGVFTGFKFTAVLIGFVGLSVLSTKLRMKHFILVGIIFLLFMIFSASYFMRFSDSLSALNYLFIRATSTAVAGTVGVWNIFPNGGEESSLSLLYIFGNKIAAIILDTPVASIEFIKVNLGRYIAYLTYPNYDEALSGELNLTVTNFGYAVYFFGQYYFFFYSIIIGIVLGALINIFRYFNNNIVLHSTFASYLFIIVLIGGGKISNIFALTSFVYILLLYVMLKTVNSNIIFRKE
jgi:hypothetical protein